MRRSRVPALALFVSSLAFQSTFIGLDVFPSDEGLPLVAAADVAHGSLLYRNCYVPVTPLAYLVQAGIFKVFGVGLLQSRLLLAVVYACCVVTAFGIAMTCMPLRFAVLAGIATILLQLWVWPHAQFFSYTPLAVLFSMLSIYLACYIEVSMRRVWYAIALGAALGLATWAKPNIGAMTGVGVLAYWFIGLAASYACAAAPRTRRFRTAFKDGMATMAGLAVVSLPLLAHLVITDTLQGMVESLSALAAIYEDVPPDLFPNLLPFTHQIQGVRVNPGLTIPGIVSSALVSDAGYAYVLSYTTWLDALVRVIYYAPLAVLLVASGYVIVRLSRGLWSIEDDVALFLICVTTCLYLTVVPHPAVHYLMPAQIPAIVLACFVNARVGGLPRIWARLLARFAFGTAWSIYLVTSALALGVYLSADRQPIHTVRGTVWLEPMQAAALQEILSFANSELPAGTPVFAFPYYPLFYFLSGTPHATRFIDLRPGSPGTSAEDEIIRRLESDHVDIAIYFSGTQYPGIEFFDSAYPRLHHYIRSHFERDRTIRTYLGEFAEVLRRRRT